MNKKLFAAVLALSMILFCFFACSEGTNDEGARLLSFSQVNSIREMQSLDGKKVTIIGYMSTVSPVSGKFIYLMNLPYQSCPFCIPNTTELSNTIAVYAPKGKEFKFTDQAIRVTGILDFGDYTDEFCYEYNYRIINASYTVFDTSNMSEELKLWQQLAASGAVSDVYNMFDYLNYLCYRQTYTAKFEDGSDYLYPSDARHFIETDGAQYNYGFKDGYFEEIIENVRSVEENAFGDLVKIPEDAQTLFEKAYAELKAENCTAVKEYSGVFNDGRSQYRLNDGTELQAEMDDIFRAFSLRLAKWEL